MAVIILTLLAVIGVTVPFMLFGRRPPLKRAVERLLFSVFIGIAIASFVFLVAISSVQIVEMGNRPSVELSDTQLKDLEKRYEIKDKKVYDKDEKVYYKGTVDVLMSNYDTNTGEVKRPIIMLTQVRVAHFDFWGNPFKSTYKNAIQIHKVVIPRDASAAKKTPQIVEVFNN